jgi:hypothetical protein
MEIVSHLFKDFSGRQPDGPPVEPSALVTVKKANRSLSAARSVDRSAAFRLTIYGKMGVICNEGRQKESGGYLGLQRGRSQLQVSPVVFLFMPENATTWRI